MLDCFLIVDPYCGAYRLNIGSLIPQGGQALFICLSELLRHSLSMTLEPRIHARGGFAIFSSALMIARIAYFHGGGVSEIRNVFE
jgi:hypothetical protein